MSLTIAFINEIGLSLSNWCVRIEKCWNKKPRWRSGRKWFTTRHIHLMLGVFIIHAFDTHAQHVAAQLMERLNPIQSNTQNQSQQLVLDLKCWLDRTNSRFIVHFHQNKSTTSRPIGDRSILNRRHFLQVVLCLLIYWQRKKGGQSWWNTTIPPWQ